ncbi:MAG: hypothetical protein IPJ77_23005 [Planctomycetes bacterium]|nr:hypothetical protein [Planctomycetota bacterium]
MSQIIKHTLVKLATPASPAARGGSNGRERGHARKEAKLVEIDGAPRAIEITCTCGEKTVVELVLDAPRANEGGAKS